MNIFRRLWGDLRRKHRDDIHNTSGGIRVIRVGNHEISLPRDPFAEGLSRVVYSGYAPSVIVRRVRAEPTAEEALAEDWATLAGDMHSAMRQATTATRLHIAQP